MKRVVKSRWLSLLLMVCLIESIACASSPGEHGITAKFLNEDVQPGEMVELRVEMIRQVWGEFKLTIPRHPKLHIIAVEKVAVKYSGGLYRQRQSVLLQPVSSGSVKLTEMALDLSSPSGVETFKLPPMELVVSPHSESVLSDTPEPLPQSHSEKNASAFGGTAFATILIASAVSSLLLTLGFLRRFQKRQLSSIKEPDTGQPQINRIMADLQRGQIRKGELEQILAESRTSMSAALRGSLEQAVYSDRGQAERIAELMRKEFFA